MGTRFDMTIIQMLCAVFSAPERETKAQFMQEWRCLFSLGVSPKKTAVRLGLDTKSRYQLWTRVKTLSLKTESNDAATVCRHAPVRETQSRVFLYCYTEVDTNLHIPSYGRGDMQTWNTCCTLTHYLLQLHDVVSHMHTNKGCAIKWAWLLSTKFKECCLRSLFLKLDALNLSKKKIHQLQIAISNSLRANHAQHAQQHKLYL